MEQLKEIKSCDHEEIRFVCFEKKYHLPDHADGKNTTDKDHPDVDDRTGFEITMVFVCEQCRAHIYGDSVPGTVKNIEWSKRGNLNADTEFDIYA
jgi:hypothetical protein